MATLLALCQAAIRDVDSFSAPSTIVGNTDPVAVLLLSLATRVGRELEREIKWAALESPYSFSTVDGTASYGLPADFRRFTTGSLYNITEEQALIGPVPGSVWADMLRGSYQLGFQYAYRVTGGYLKLNPTPSSVQSLGYDYYSRYFCTNSGGTPIAGWTADSDIFRLDEELAVLGISYRFKARKGLPYTEEKADYMAAVDALRYDETAKGIIDVSGVPRYRNSNIPSRSWG